MERREVGGRARLLAADAAVGDLLFVLPSCTGGISSVVVGVEAYGYLDRDCWSTGQAWGRGGQPNQASTVLVDAVEAAGAGGSVDLRVRDEAAAVVVEVADDGPACRRTPSTGSSTRGADRRRLRVRRTRAAQDAGEDPGPGQTSAATCSKG